MGTMRFGGDDTRTTQHHGQRVTPQELVELGRRIMAARGRREMFFSGDLFGEPGWEMLLALYEANCAGHRLTSTNLCIASRAPQTTGLRWLTSLLELDLISRRSNPLDARVVFIELNPHARTAIEAYLSELWVLLYGPD